MECSICCTNFNKSKNKKIECKTCKEDEEVKVCTGCAKRYILDKPTDASCMVCKVEWSYEFLSETFTKTFLNKELKEHRERYLLEKELAKMPETQKYAEKVKMVEELIKQKDIQILKKRELEDKLRRINENVRNVTDAINDLRNSKEKNEKLKMYYKCPIENCNGFLNEDWVCGICENKICKHCMEKEEEEHVCKESNIETVKLLKKDSKPCPKCGEFINKTEGCDQMYCIRCHTAFSWRTGMIERGNIHNPEYYRWMRENGKVIQRAEENPMELCDNNVIDYTTLINLLRHYNMGEIQRINNRDIYVDKEETVKILNMHRLILHINNENELGRVREREIDNNLRDLRAYYILGKITQEELKRKLQTINKKSNKENKINNIWNLLRIVLIEYVGKISDIPYGKNEGQNIMKNIVIESEKIRDYCNNSLKKIGDMYNMTYPGITKDWIIMYNWKTYMNTKKN